MTDLRDVQELVYDLHRVLSTTSFSELSVKDQSKIMKLQTLLLDVDSMLDDYVPNPDPIDDPNYVGSKHHY